jgi:hypothetical protein
MVTRKFIEAEISKLQKKVDDDREKYGYSGSPSTLKTIERNEDLIHCLEYALAHRSDVDEGYKIFSKSVKTLHAYYLEIISNDISDAEKFIRIEKTIQGMTYWEGIQNDKK